MNTISKRLTKLETLHSSEEIPIWCNDIADMPGTIDAMVAGGELREADRARCVHWTQARAQGRHEEALRLLHD